MAKAELNSSAMTTSPHKWLLMFFLLSTTFSFNSFSSSATQPQDYYHHCSSTVPSSPQNKAPLPKFPLPRTHEGYYTGGNPVLEPNPFAFSSGFLNSIFLRTLSVYDTEVPGLFKLEGRLTFPSANKYNKMEDFSYPRQVYYSTSERSSVSFKLEGFWSESKGDLCMVGSASAYTKEGNLLDLSAVLKLHNLISSTNITSLITGSFESLSTSANDPTHFEKISVLLLPQMEYKYTPVSGDFKNGNDLPKGLSLSSLPKHQLCSVALGGFHPFKLRYDSGCNSATNCSPFDAGMGYVPRFMSMSMIKCSEDKETMRVLVEFPPNTSYISYYRSFNPETTLVGEGTWDETEHQLCIVACRISGVKESWVNARVGDCSTRLTLRFPAIWSIKDVSDMVGEISTNKTMQEKGYFDRIMFRSVRNRMAGVPDLKYQYTEIDTARKLCQKSEKPARIKGARYPNGSSISVMRFDSSVKNSTGTIGWGYSVPISVGALFYEYSSSQDSEAEAPDLGGSGPVNISYHINLQSYNGFSPFNASSTSYESYEILAEGIYDAETGRLCMVGCRNIGSDDQIPRNDSWDCEILVEFQFPSLNSRRGGYIKGSINSARHKSDKLYFERLELSATYEDGSSIWRMDVEIVMVLISTTLSCVFVVLQIFHVKRHPHVLPLISLVMLSVLTLGQLVPLVLNFEALFFRSSSRWNIMHESDGWLEANEVIVRVTGMVAFLLQFRLLQKTWSARWSDGNQKSLWGAEKKVLFVALPLYIAGALVPVVVNLLNSSENDVMMASAASITSSYPPRSLWGGLKSYAGLVLDGFLLPQILLNMFWNTKRSSLSCSFYLGNTFVRLLPHAYDLYRAHKYAHHYDGSYIYANPGADFYSYTWDVVIPLGGLLFALIIYLQQKFGGRCIFPRRLRELEGYEKVPVSVSSDA
ncbi:uncharacterized protein LOC132176078 [Corylus avellana]|uniref:uncharacterized protein LOC132176078 n=1 Tax=Corylus avellana TaxID=13451 RepID=UPI001E2393A1|nr:uncharacterized protein LOC132176078 [Corylus avellana]